MVSARGDARPLAAFATALAAVAFGLNWLWEMLQMPAYREMAGRSWAETLVPCTLAALGDVGLTFAAFGLGALAAGRLRWGKVGGWNVYAAAALLGSVFAVAVELRSTASGLWSYTDRMPVVPVLGVGLWPLLQLTLLIPVSIRVAWCGSPVRTGLPRARATRERDHHRDRDREGRPPA